MRQQLLRTGANELSYEIRGIVKKAEQLQKIGYDIQWENIGDPIEKDNRMPEWMRNIISELVQDSKTFGYCHSKGVPATREFLAEKTNALGGVQISQDDILFFNGLGDAISKVYQYILPTSRIIGPSPAYSTHSSAEAAHANAHPLTYKLDPQNNWYPDMEDLYLKVKYNPNIVGILIINPDNPTGMVYPQEILKRFVEIAKEFDLFLICDEIYHNVTYNGAIAHQLAEYIEDVPGLALKGISKEFPWPGSRCGWIEYYNRDNDEQFDKLCQTLDNAKMIEVCSTKLPQLAIPKVMSDPRYLPYRKAENEKIGKRSKIIAELLGDLPYIYFNETFGAFYNTIIFKDDVLNQKQSLKIENPQAKGLLDEWLNTEEIKNDKRFVYNLLASKGICVVPISSFCSDLQGFRVTLLEENEDTLRDTFGKIREAIIEYCTSA
ncbi:pyridoxal phosphate-dependent aminotransferase [Sediminitomix flava]|uniref:alanine transaminase n=1 Tax=Sediminitomix flava TaxID=379075 RepID=A0A315Z6G2_SEDFL|nr:pyridoxal phosphate-dependent aminotransferase [Sediminitomix flava]PWJ39977.1 aspartate/methionine/tyrosine aminotransferase [Sediminitomix flava]